jgi:hypothetical protein
VPPKSEYEPALLKAFSPLPNHFTIEICCAQTEENNTHKGYGSISTTNSPRFKEVSTTTNGAHFPHYNSVYHEEYQSSNQQFNSSKEYSTPSHANAAFHKNIHPTIAECAQDEDTQPPHRDSNPLEESRPLCFPTQLPHKKIRPPTQEIDCKEMKLGSNKSNDEIWNDLILESD